MPPKLLCSTLFRLFEATLMSRSRFFTPQEPSYLILMIILYYKTQLYIVQYRHYIVPALTVACFHRRVEKFILDENVRSDRLYKCPGPPTSIAGPPTCQTQITTSTIPSLEKLSGTHGHSQHKYAAPLWLESGTFTGNAELFGGPTHRSDR